MDTRTIEFLRAMQRIVGVVERHDDLRQLAAESKAFDLFRDAVAELERWEPRRAANQLEIERGRVETREAVRRLLGDLACVHAAAQLTPPHVAAVPPFKVPSPNDHAERLIAAAHGIVTVARHFEQQLIDSGMHPRKLDDIEQSAAALREAHLAWAIAEAYSGAFPPTLVHLKTQVRKRYAQL